MIDTRFQRDTSFLKYAQTRTQIEAFYDSALLINKGKFVEATHLIQDILMQMKQLPYNAFELELKFQLILLEAYSLGALPLKHQNVVSNIIGKLEKLLGEIQGQIHNYMQQEQEQEWDEGENIIVRIYTCLVQLSVKFQVVPLDNWVKRLAEKLKTHRSYIPQVYGKLCGCKNLNLFKQNFMESQIMNDSKKSAMKKAQFFQIAANWLIIVGEFDRGIRCKKLASQLWKNANRLLQYETCQSELGSLQKNKKVSYCLKLKRLTQVIRILNCELQDKQIRTSKKPAIYYDACEKIIRKSLKEILQVQTEYDKQMNISQNRIKKSTKASSLKKSLFTKQSKLTEYYGKCKHFYEIYKNENKAEITQILIDHSKFIRMQKNKYQRLLLPIWKHFTKRQKYGFYKIKTLYLIKYGILNKEFLNSLPQKGASVFLPATGVKKRQKTEQKTIFRTQYKGKN